MQQFRPPPSHPEGGRWVGGWVGLPGRGRGQKVSVPGQCSGAQCVWSMAKGSMVPRLIRMGRIPSKQQPGPEGSAGERQQMKSGLGGDRRAVATGLAVPRRQQPVHMPRDPQADPAVIRPDQISSLQWRTVAVRNLICFPPLLVCGSWWP